MRVMEHIEQRLDIQLRLLWPFQESVPRDDVLRRRVCGRVGLSP